MGKAASPNSNLAFGEEGQELDRTRKHIKQTARDQNLPEQFVSEARVGMAEVERSLANARAIDVESQANLREQQAKISAHRQEAASREQIALADAENRRKQANAEQSKLYATVSARQREVDSTVARNELGLAALPDHSDSEFHELQPATSTTREAAMFDVISHARRRLERTEIRSAVSLPALSELN